MPTFRVAAVSDLGEVCDFLRENFTVETLRSWTYDLSELVLWFIQSRLCGVSGSDGITAVVMGRPVSNEKDGMIPFSVNWKGEMLWVDCVASDEGMKHVWKEAIRFLQSHSCNFTKVAWCRSKRDAFPRVFDFSAIDQRMQGATWAF